MSCASMILPIYLNRMDVLHTWKSKCSPEATYDSLLHVFVKGRFTDCAAEIVAILSEDWTYII